ncbi:hypothetical protein M7I_3668 [Glarea lozoyensis 74030]|uniref:Uncharacterized protein n=1 Tax=Glarea lozoyensis (strain ATCC 74030 / MF5533) TaxID=1104152 RepID=H0EM42_GLAL7|nr:hypothetical protein M7I_3668 [Glarea lozoyensis 74030]
MVLLRLPPQDNAGPNRSYDRLAGSFSIRWISACGDYLSPSAVAFGEHGSTLCSSIVIRTGGRYRWCNRRQG